MRSVKARRDLAAALAAALLTLGPTAAPAWAHHALTMYDHQVSTTLEGTVKAFDWSNPHSSIQLVVRDAASGKEAEWSIEAGSPNMLSHKGWTMTSLKPGDKATIVIHPMKDGSTGGTLVKAMVNGAQVGS
jgi:hypothetical protein